MLRSMSNSSSTTRTTFLRCNRSLSSSSLMSRQQRLLEGTFLYHKNNNNNNNMMMMVFGRRSSAVRISTRAGAAVSRVLQDGESLSSSSSSSSFGRVLGRTRSSSSWMTTRTTTAAASTIINNSSLIHRPLLLYPQQLQQFSSSSSQFPPTNIWQIPRKGTGFDHFLRRDGSGSGKNDGSGGGEGGSNNNNNNNGGPDYSSLFWFVAAATMLAYVVSSSSLVSSDEQQQHESGGAGIGGGDPAGMHQHREISWHDFLRLLQQRDIVKVLIENPNSERPMAKVYVKQNATGLARTTAGGGASAGGSFYDDGRHPHQGEEEESHARSSSSSVGRNSGGGRTLPSRRRASTVPGHHSNKSTAADADEFLNHPPQDEVHGMGSSSSVNGGGIATASAAANTNTNQPTGIAGSSSSSSSPLYYRLPIGNLDSFERKLEESQRALGRDYTQDVPVQFAADATMGREVLAALPGILLAAFLYAMIRYASVGGGAGGGRGFGSGSGGGGSGGGGGMGGIFQIGKSTHKKISKQDVNINFSDVAGCDEAKKEIMEFVDFLKDSDRFTKLGAKIPKGALLCGPPGTGKTLLAKAVAGEAGVPFYTISGSDFIEMFVGVGPSRVRDLFQEARASAPCIVFIDEIDAVGRQRGRGGIGGNDERENTLNQLLVEMDGFEPSTGVVVLAGTNRVDILDQALTRPGRFDRQITIDKPDLQGRKAIFKVHLTGIALEDDVDDVAGRLAGLTPGFAGADIANICNEAAIVAARRKANSVSLDDFEKATDRIIGGLESNKIMSKEERSIVAHHEAGHAIAGWFLEHADPLLKVTIIPRTSGALGFAQYLPKEVFLRTYDQIMDIVCMALAGRAAEEIFFGRVTTGASDDLKRVTELVFSTIQLYGMNPRLGQLSFPKDPNAVFDERPYSEKTAKVMDDEARSIVDAAYERTLTLLKSKRSEVEKVATMLLDKETITHEDIVNVIGPRPFKGDPAYEEFIQRRRKDKEEHGEIDGTSTPEEEEDGGSNTPLNPGLA